MAISRRNKQFVESKLDVIKTTKTVKEIILDELLHTNGFTAGELYKKLPSISQRQIRHALLELKNSKIITDEKKCRCHAASIYEVRNEYIH